MACAAVVEDVWVIKEVTVTVFANALVSFNAAACRVDTREVGDDRIASVIVESAVIVELALSERGIANSLAVRRKSSGIQLSVVM